MAMTLPRALASLAIGALAFASLAPVLPDALAGDAAPKVEIHGTEFRITRADGSLVSEAEMIGAVLTITDPGGGRIVFRIDEVMRDPGDPTGEVRLYKLMTRDPASGEWKNMCMPGPGGLAMGFPLSGTWTPVGEHLPSDQLFSLTCTSGAQAKCVRMGYKPWKSASDGTSLWDHHQACTRMVRADYCGNGTSYTRNGTRINVYDTLNIQVADPAPDLSFEAAWGTQGAVCLRKVRIPEKASLEGLVGICPGRLKGKVGPACDEGEAMRSPATLVMNGS